MCRMAQLKLTTNHGCGGEVFSYLRVQCAKVWKNLDKSSIYLVFLLAYFTENINTRAVALVSK